MFLKQSTAVTVKVGPFVDSTDGNTQETALTIAQADIRLSKNGGAFAQTNNVAGATHDANGWYGVPLDTTDTGTLGKLELSIHETGALAVWRTFMVVPANVWDSLFGADKLQVHADEITAGLITAAALAADAVTELRSVASGTADSGTTTTMVDAALTEVDANYWRGNRILFTSGAIAGQCRLITDFSAATDTITFTPPTTQAVGTNTYEILPGAAVNVRMWRETAVAVPTVEGVPEVDLVLFNGVAQTATPDTIKADTAATLLDTGMDGVVVNAAGLATDAVNEIRDAIAAITITELASVPGASPTLIQAVAFGYMAQRNKRDTTASADEIHNDAGAVIGTAALSDDGTTFTKAEYA